MAGGTPNVSESVRAIPNALFQAPWFDGIVGPSLRRRSSRRRPAAADDSGSGQTTVQALVPQMPLEIYEQLSLHGKRPCGGDRTIR